MLDVVKLQCPACSGVLEIAHDLDQFACGHCGASSVVRRAGGTISLAPLGEAPGPVERTPADVAVKRLEGELVRLRGPLQQHYTEKSNIEALFLFGCILAVMGAGLFLIQWWVGAAVVILGGALIPMMWRSRRRLIEQLRNDESAIARCKAELQQQRDLVRL